MQRLGWIALGLCALVWGLHVHGAWAYPLGNDPAIFQFHAWAMTQGLVPYVDTFEFNTPGIILLHWAWGAVAGFSDGAFLGLALGLSTVALAGTGATLWRRINPAALALGLAAGVWAFGHITPWDRGQRELFQGLFLLASFAAAAPLRTRAAQSRRSAAGWGALSGVLAGCAVCIKLSVLPLVWAAWMVWLFECTKAQRDFGRPGAMRVVFGGVATLVGFAVPIAAVIGWLVSVEALDAFWNIQTSYLPVHRRLLKATLGEAIALREFWIVLSLGGLGLVASVRKHTAALRVLGLVHLMAAALYLAQGHAWIYHLHIAVPFTAALVALSADALLGDQRITLAVALVPLVLASITVRFDHTAGQVRARHIDEHWDHRAHEKVAAYLKAQGPRTDRVVTNNDEHQLLLMAERLPATPFLYGFLFSESHPEELLRDMGLARWTWLNARPPQWIVWNTKPYRPELDTLEKNPRAASWIRSHCAERMVEGAGPYRVFACR